MRILTGQDRHTYETLITESAKYAALVSQMAVQLGELKAYLAREQQRADNAVDELLTVKGLAPISPSVPTEIPIDDPWQEDPVKVEGWRKFIQEHGVAAAFKGEAT